MRAAGDDDRTIGCRHARLEGVPGKSLDIGLRLQMRLERAAPRLATEKAAQGRCQDDAGYRRSLVDQGDIDGEFAIAAEELLGAVERVNEIETLAGLRNEAGGGRFLGNYRNVGILALETGKNNPFRRLVGLGYRGQIGFLACRQRLRIDGHYFPARRYGKTGERQEAGRGRGIRHDGRAMPAIRKMVNAELLGAIW